MATAAVHGSESSEVGAVSGFDYDSAQTQQGSASSSLSSSLNLGSSSSSLPAHAASTKRERRKSLRERLVGSILQNGGSVPVGKKGEQGEQGEPGDQNRLRTPCDGSQSAGPRLRYKSATNMALSQSVPQLPTTERPSVDPFRSLHEVPMYLQKQASEQALFPEAQGSTISTNGAKNEATTRAGEEDPAQTPDDARTAGNWRKMRKLIRTMKLSRSGDNPSSARSTDEEDKDGQNSPKVKAKKSQKAAGESKPCQEPQVSIHVLIKRGDIEEARKAIKKFSKREKDADDIVNVKTCDGSTPLHTAVEVGNAEMVQLLLTSGSNPDIVDAIGWTPLLAACKAGDLMIAKVLLEEGNADANCKTNDLNTPLHYLASKSPKEDNKELFFEVMTKLLGKEGKVYGMVCNNSTSRNKNGDTPLHYAALYSKPSVVQWLLEHHASVNNQNTYGDTPLHCAVARGDHEIVKLLLKSGACKKLAGRAGTAKEIAVKEHPDKVELQALF